MASSFEIALLDEVSRRFGQKEEASGQYDGPKELNGLREIEFES